MSDVMREEFEAWAVTDYKYSLTRFFTDLRYDDDDTEAAWDAWQASRERLVIKPEWPDHYGYTSPDCAGAAILDCRSAFNVSARAAGVKTK